MGRTLDYPADKEIHKEYVREYNNRPSPRKLSHHM